MAEVKHTPGPWESHGSFVITTADVPSGRTFGYGCGNRFICDLNDGEYHEYDSVAEQEANARLIAAAPDLFEALPDLTHVIAWLRNGCEVEHAVTELEIYQRRIDAALSKATTQQEGR